MRTYTSQRTGDLSAMICSLMLVSASILLIAAKLHGEFVGVAITRLGRGEAAAR